MATRWSPDFNNWVIVLVAANPEANVMAYLPPSKAAKHFSKQSRVGFPLREYSYLKWYYFKNKYIYVAYSSRGVFMFWNLVALIIIRHKRFMLDEMTQWNAWKLIMNALV